ncbi:unnamed protein product, partial [Owenia fusiformis]
DYTDEQDDIAHDDDDDNTDEHEEGDNHTDAVEQDDIAHDDDNDYTDKHEEGDNHTDAVEHDDIAHDDDNDHTDEDNLANEDGKNQDAIIVDSQIIIPNINISPERIENNKSDLKTTKSEMVNEKNKFYKLEPLPDLGETPSISSNDLNKGAYTLKQFLNMTITQTAPFYKEITMISKKWKQNDIISSLIVTRSYMDQLLNWLIAARLRLKPPISPILLYTPDYSIAKFFKDRQFDCVYLNTSDILKEHLYINLRQIWYLRIMVWKTINFIGFDVLNFDADALPLKNPFPLLKSPKVLSSDVVGAFVGNKPNYVKEEWNLNSAFCMGFMLFRRTRKTEAFWQNVNDFIFGSTKSKESTTRTDQSIINSVLHLMHVTWKKSIVNACSDSGPCLKETYQGMGSNGFRITTLPEQITCRFSCKITTHIHKVTIWHPIKNTVKGNVWFLVPDWQDKVKSSHATGTEFLKELADISKIDLSNFF